MTKRVWIIVAILVVLIVLYLAYTRYLATKQAEIINSGTANQLALIQAQTAQQEACKKNWYCALQESTQGFNEFVGNVF